jgi:parvulin-like peptidyl-prolyl isomerase
MLAAEMMLQVTADVPYAAEHVHARYLQVEELSVAQTLLRQVRGGSDFAVLASQYSLDQVTAQDGGDLGFFARGSLTVPEVEEAAFALEPGEVSDVIEAVDGETGQPIYYLVELIERDPSRPLSTDLRARLLQATFSEWLAVQRQNATITPFLEE